MKIERVNLFHDLWYAITRIRPGKHVNSVRVQIRRSKENASH